MSLQQWAETRTCQDMTELARTDVMRMGRWRTLTDGYAQITGPAGGQAPPAPLLRQHVCVPVGERSSSDQGDDVPFRFDEATRRKVVVPKK